MILGRHNIHYLLLPALLVGLCAHTGAATPWWHPDWEQRVELRLPMTAERFTAPVTITGRALRGSGLSDAVSMGSFRVIGPTGEVPCQVDERDGTGELRRHANHVLDDDDELFFLGKFGPSTPVTYHIYCSVAPRPPGRYQTSLRYGRPSAAFNSAPIHGTFYDREFKVSVKGPKLPDPKAHSLLNYCSGAITTLRWRSYDFIAPSRSWNWFLPNHPFGGGPSTVVWTLPKLVCDGPVRKTVRMEATSLSAPVRRVRHYVAVYAQCATVDFEQVVEYSEGPTPSKDLCLNFAFAVTPDTIAAAGIENGAVRRTLTPDEDAAQAAGELVHLCASDKLDAPRPWWAWSSPARQLGLALFFAEAVTPKRGVMSPEKWSFSTYVRRNQSHTRVCLKPTAQPVLHHALRFTGIVDLDRVPFLFTAWSQPVEEWATLGQVEQLQGEAP